MSLCALSCWLLPALLLLLVSFPCCLHWADLWSCWVPLPATLPSLPQRFSLSMLGSFSKVPCLLWLDDFTALFLLFLTMHTCSSLTAQLLFASFIFYPCTAEPRTQLCFTELGLGTGSWPWSPGSATGENQGNTEQLQSQVSPGMAPARALAVQGSLIPPCKFNSDLEWCVICVWKFRLF